MSTSRLSTKGQLVIPASIRKALNLRPGDKIDLTLEGQRVVLQRKAGRIAKLKRGPFGRMILTTSPRMPVTTEDVIALLEELP
jgi:AbrB family looped-hinge helix DNA binding protein